MKIDRQKALNYLTGARERLATSYGVRRIGIFGSVARGTGRDSSDLDVLVDMDNPTFDRYMDLKFEIEDHLGAPVDLVFSSSLKERLRPSIERETIYV